MHTTIIIENRGKYFGTIKFKIIDIDKVLSLSDNNVFPYTKLSSFINLHDQSIKEIIEIYDYQTINTNNYDLVIDKFRKTINSIYKEYTNAVIIYRVIPGIKTYSNHNPTIQDYANEITDGELLAVSTGFMKINGIFDYGNDPNHSNNRMVTINHKRQDGNGYIDIALPCNVFIYINAKSRLIIQKYMESSYKITCPYL